MKIKSLDTSKDFTLKDNIFKVAMNSQAVYQSVVAEMNNARQGTSSSKNRSLVSGGGKKPFRQKGTGRARAGTTRGPIWRGGGVTFAAQPRDHIKKLNKKMYQSALRSVLSELVRQDRIVIVKEFVLKSHKTKELASQLSNLNVNDVLIVTTEVTENITLASRNLRKVDVCKPVNLDLISLIKPEKVLITLDALKLIEERLG